MCSYTGCIVLCVHMRQSVLREMRLINPDMISDYVTDRASAGTLEPLASQCDLPNVFGDGMMCSSCNFGPWL